MQDSNQVRANWKLGRVSKADASLRDGYVRSIEIQYKNINSNSFVTITRPVQKVVVIVPVDEDINDDD